MSFLLIVALIILGFFLYRVLISGSGGGRSFIQFYKDHNEIRNEIQKRGGIHNVESTNIEQLKEIGYEVREYGENFVEMIKNDSNGESRVNIIHGRNGKSLKLSFCTQSGEEVINIKNKMRSSNGAIECISRNINEYLDGHFDIDEIDKEKVRSHFKVINT